MFKFHNTIDGDPPLFLKVFVKWIIPVFLLSEKTRIWSTRVWRSVTSLVFHWVERRQKVRIANKHFILLDFQLYVNAVPF